MEETMTLSTEIDYELYNIDGIELVFDSSAKDQLCYTIRQAGACTTWMCTNCVYQFFDRISCAPTIMNIVLAQPQQHIIDIGCHIGTHSLPLARYGHTVTAIDGSSDSIACLEKAKESNNFSNITTIQAVLSNAEYSCTFNPKSLSWSSMNNEQDTNLEYTTTTLDKLLSLDSCDAIKINVEGYEKEVLEGAVKTINKFYPMLMIEIDNYLLHIRDIKCNEIFTLLAEMGYDVLQPSLSTDLKNLNLREINPLDMYPVGIGYIVAVHKANRRTTQWFPPFSPEELQQQLQHSYDPQSPFKDYLQSLMYHDIINKVDKKYKDRDELPD